MERFVANRFPSAALLRYQLCLGLSSVFAKKFDIFLKPYRGRVYTVELAGAALAGLCFSRSFLPPTVDFRLGVAGVQEKGRRSQNSKLTVEY